MDMPTDILALLGLWMYAAIQFAKGRAFPENITIYLSLGIPFLLAGVVVYGNEQLVTYASTTAKLFLFGTGAWAIGKAGQAK